MLKSDSRSLADVPTKRVGPVSVVGIGKTFGEGVLGTLVMRQFNKEKELDRFRTRAEYSFQDYIVCLN